MGGIISCKTGRCDDIPEGTDDLIMGRNKPAKAWADLEVGAIAVVQLPFRISTEMVGVVRVSQREVRLLESASECRCDGSGGNTCALGARNCLYEAAAA